MSLSSTSRILYVRASLGPFARQIKAAGGIKGFLAIHFQHDEVFSPYFRRPRLFWESPHALRNETNSGALGKKLAAYSNAVLSSHPSHRFVGIGDRVARVLRAHDYTTSCFFPINELAESSDFSMLLLGCVEQSPGFSTVHATQQVLGLSQKHLFRYLVRWDVSTDSGRKSMVATESPGCSQSFDKFYAAYQRDDNLISGELFGEKYLFVPSVRRALALEQQILQEDPRFVDCGRMTCVTCRFRLY